MLRRRLCQQPRKEPQTILKVAHVDVRIVGISGALLPHIFGLFAQSSRTITASAGGLGVGLAVVRAVAESHGGTVSAISAGPGMGSEFTLRLPIVLERPMAGEPA
ncbi:ATP-binding protein [Paraburkholderia terrae]|uniref:histidine kinase n=1 Tax=Paraburkholderia terrae TaxID=311230 RepID=A0A2I8F450_9BURK|nr:ATP-binding protein [Paraburkholderia terrae]AUT66321.1 ATP-binding protein [Paraburkholderia terrae]